MTEAGSAAGVGKPVAPWLTGLVAVLDWGGLAVGNPAVDLIVAWEVAFDGVAVLAEG